MDEDLRLAIYRGLELTGRVPTVAELATSLGAEVDEVQAGMQRLHEARQLVLDRAGNVVLAHPFAAVSFGFSVMGQRTLWWGGCAWDSFAIPHLVSAEPQVLVATQCQGCGRPLSWVVGRDHPPSGTEVAHFLVPASRMWDDIVTTCGHQRIFCDEACVDRWLGDAGLERGDVLDLSTLWQLASRWYEGRLERGYVRRELDEARAYFRSVGLRGAFWGLGGETDPSAV